MKTNKDLFNKKLAERIIEIRKSKGISQIELGTMCNFEKPNMSRIESGKYTPSLTTLLKISDALDVHIKELFEI